MSEVFGLPDALNDMSPVTLPRRFTTDFIMGRISDDLAAQVVAADTRVAAGKDVVVIEGTGHAGVGAVIDLSNARVAALLGAPVIIVSEGGVGRPIDEIVLDRALLAAHDVRVLGAVVNKVDVESHPQLPEVLERGLAQHGIDLLGCIPYSAFLANPSLELIATHLDGEILSGRRRPSATNRPRRNRRDAAEHAIAHLAEWTLLITPGDRDDLLRAALEANRRRAELPLVVSVIIRSGGYRPPDSLLGDLRATGSLHVFVATDTYRTAQAVDEIPVKSHPPTRRRSRTHHRSGWGERSTSTGCWHVC